MAGGADQTVGLAAVIEFIENLFPTKNNPRFTEESGLTVQGRGKIKAVGYCTNLTLDVIEKAAQNDVDLLITHHDAWDFIFGLKRACQKKLRDYNISHYFNHLPLDDCDFGTNSTLMAELGAKITEKTHVKDGFSCGRIGEFPLGITLAELVKDLQVLLGEPLQAWKFNAREIKRIGLVCGGGGLTHDLKEAVAKNCDAYITGEKTLYTLQYAQFAKINLVIGSHTFTEIFGVVSLAEKIREKWGFIDIVELAEERLETAPDFSFPAGCRSNTPKF